MMKAHITVKSGVITKPLLAARVEDNDLTSLKFPVGLTCKIDGLRCLKLDGRAVSRSFKPIPNHHIRGIIEKWVPDGMDMEITSGKTFQECSGNIMREDGTPEFKLWVIDYVPSDLNEPFQSRIEAAAKYASQHWKWIKTDWGRVPFKWEVLLPTMAQNILDIEKYESQILGMGFEGVMIRDLNGRYKCGRSTFNEGILIKVKRFSSMEARVVGVEPLMRNNNEAEKNVFGRTERSTAKVGLVADELMGKLVVVGINGDYKDVQFEVGTGFTQEQRQNIWQDRKANIGKIMTISYFPQGCKDVPRFPVFHGWRHPIDID